MISGPARTAFRPRLALIAFVFATAACANPPPERTAERLAIPAPTSAASPGRHPETPATERAIALINSGFESATPEPGGDPEGWLTGQHAGETSYLFVVDSATSHGGKQSVRIDNVGGEPFGSIVQFLPGREFAGKTLRFSAWLKTKEADGNGATLFIIAEFAGSHTAYDFMAGREIRGTRDWARHSVTVTVPASADRLRVGATLQGKGSVWFDDAELEVVTVR